MIETKEQYEKIMRHTPFYGGPDVQETIEALREVARGALFYIGHTDVYVDEMGEKREALKSSLDALPDWLTDE